MRDLAFQQQTYRYYRSSSNALQVQLGTLSLCGILIIKTDYIPSTISSVFRANYLHKPHQCILCFPLSPPHTHPHTMHTHTHTHTSNTSLPPHYPVIGWFNTTTQMGIDSFTAPEDALGYDIRVDYIKGSGPTNLQFIVTAVPLDTTSMSTSVMSTLYFEPPPTHLSFQVCQTTF